MTANPVNALMPEDPCFLVRRLDGRRPLPEMRSHILGEGAHLPKLICDRPDENLLNAGGFQLSKLLDALCRRSDQRAVARWEGAYHQRLRDYNLGHERDHAAGRGQGSLLRSGRSG